MNMAKRQTDTDGYTRTTRPGGKHSRPTATWTAEFLGWIDFSIPVQRKQDFDAWVSDVNLDETLVTRMAAGDKFTVGLDEFTETYYANVFIRNPANVNAGWMTSQRSSTPLRALYKLLFAVELCMPDDWSGLAFGGQERTW
jgi:hypothetical protein